MTKPGYHPWAKDDVWTGPIDAGLSTKVQPPDANRDEGYYRKRRPGPAVINWQMNRNAITHETVARMQAMSYQSYLSSSQNLHGGRIYSSCCTFQNTMLEPYLSIFGWDDAAGGGTDTIDELMGRVWYPSAATGITSAPTAVDAAGNGSTHRVLTVAQGGATDTVRYKTAFGAWTNTSIVGAAPGGDWYSVASDCDTAGNGVAHWCVAGWVAPNMALWSSTDGINFATEAGFPAGGSALRGVYHSHHHAGALGPDDAGNPVWLTNNSVDQVYYSTDHVTWSTGGLLSLYDLSSPRAMAYSMPKRRWVAAHSGTSFGVVSYSDDNGVNWTTDTSALPIIATMQNASTKAYISGDGYGTFVITRQAQPSDTGDYMWISVDDGVSWSVMRPTQRTVVDDGFIVEPCFLPGVDLDATPESAGSFMYAYYSDALTTVEISRSLVV